MDEIYLRYFADDYGDYIVLIDHSSCIDDTEALFRAQKDIVAGKGFIITKVEYPYIHCTRVFGGKNETETR